MEHRRWKFSYVSFFSTVVFAVLWSPVFGNNTPERLPRLLLVAVIIAVPYAFVCGTYLDMR